MKNVILNILYAVKEILMLKYSSFSVSCIVGLTVGLAIPYTIVQREWWICLLIVSYPMFVTCSLISWLLHKMKVIS